MSGASLDVAVVTHNSGLVLPDLLGSLWPDSDVAEREIAQRVHLVESGQPDRTGVGGFGAKRATALPNFGYGTAANFALLSSAADWVALLNPDVRVSFDVLTACVEVAEKVGAAVVAPSIRDGAGREIQHPTRVSTPPWKRKHEQQEPLGHGAQSCAAVLGCVMVINRREALRVGLFDDKYFLYSEEIDLCFRMSKRGLLVASVPGEYATHLSEQGSGQVDATWRSAQRIRGRARFQRVHFGWLAMAMLLVRDIFRALRKDHNPRRVFALLKFVVVDPRRGLPDRTATLAETLSSAAGDGSRQRSANCGAVEASGIH